MMGRLAVLILLVGSSHAIDNGLGLSPPSACSTGRCRLRRSRSRRRLGVRSCWGHERSAAPSLQFLFAIAVGWSANNAWHWTYGQDVMIASYEALASKGRLVDGQPTSMADVGYVNANVDVRF